MTRTQTADSHGTCQIGMYLYSGPFGIHSVPDCAGISIHERIRVSWTRTIDSCRTHTKAQWQARAYVCVPFRKGVSNFGHTTWQYMHTWTNRDAYIYIQYHIEGYVSHGHVSTGNECWDKYALVKRAYSRPELCIPGYIGNAYILSSTRQKWRAVSWFKARNGIFTSKVHTLAKCIHILMHICTHMQYI